MVASLLPPGSACGVDTLLVRRIVDAFYARVRADALLGPIFENAVSDWPTHLTRLAEFWASITLMTGTYKGQPLQAHMHLPDLTDAHFLRWLAHFEQTLEDLCTPEQAELFMVRARRIADSFRSGLGQAHGRLVGPLDDRNAAS
jgi:hemoglobin